MRGSPSRVTIYTVADKASVSISTVSLVMNAPHRVRPETRDRVMAAAAELGYRRTEPRTGQTGGLRVVVAGPFSSYPSYFRRLAGMLAPAARTGVELIPQDLGSAAATTSPLLDSLPASRAVDGLIVMGVPLGIPALRASRAAGFPVVGVDIRREQPRPSDPPVVLIDDLHGGRLLGEHLYAQGHRRAIFLHDHQESSDYVSAGMLRHRGVSEFLQLSLHPVTGADQIGGVIDTLGTDRSITAVVASHDALAARMLRAATAAGLRVPQDLAITGYDDGELAETSDLTTVRQPLEESGATALRLVLATAAQTGSPGGRVDLQPELVIRGTG